VGLVNGLIITRLGVNSLVTTLGTSVILDGIIQLKTHGQTIVQGIPTALTSFGYGTVLGIPETVYVALAVAFVVYYLLRSTPFGRYLYAIGANREAARLVGLNVRRLVLTTFVTSGLLCGGAGLLQVAVSGAGNPRVGDGFTLPALAAAFLSVAAIRPGRYNVWGCVVAISFLAVLNSGLNLAGAGTSVTDLANGIALILGVALAVQLGRRSRKGRMRLWASGQASTQSATATAGRRV
jgi:ribose transport system permease protein